MKAATSSIEAGPAKATPFPWNKPDGTLQKMSDSVLIHFSGRDKRGLSASLTQILAEHQVCILDIGQAVVHETLALGMLIEVPGDQDFSLLQNALAEQSERLGLQVRFTHISSDAMKLWVHSQGTAQFIITLLGRSVTAAQLWRVTAIVESQNLNVDRIERLSTPLSLAAHTNGQNACVELRVSGHIYREDEMRAALLAITEKENIDIAFQRESIFRRNRRLFAFDMDSTLIQGEVIDEMAKLAGVEDQVVAITRSAMRGEIEFKESFRRRVALLKGLPVAQVHSLIHKIPLVEGADRLIRTLKMLGYKTAILSGGFTFFGEYLQSLLGIDYVFANELLTADGLVTGEVVGTVIDGPGKADRLRQIAEKECISLEQVVAVGDGANDLPMLKIAGMGIAFHAKPIVRESAHHSLSYLGLDSLLYLVGVRDRDLSSDQHDSALSR